MKSKPAVEAVKRRPFFTPLGVERMLLACYAGLATVSILATSDAPPGLGMFVVQSFLWTLLACGLAAFYVWQPQRTARWDWFDTSVCSWLVWTAITTVAVLGIGDMRAAVNGCWQSVAFGLAILMGRRLLNTPDRRNGATTLVIGLTLLLAMHGLYQYAIITPQTIRRIEADPQAFLKQAGIEGELDSPEAQTFLNRATSTEPLATFALTNSLAGCLLPAMVLLLSSLDAQRRSGSRLPYSTLFVCLTIFILLNLCLLLTKSRTALLALLISGSLVALRRWRVDLRWLAGGAAAIALLLVLMFTSGIWDREVLSEAPKSVLYRLEYWYSSLGMIRDHWLLGVGLGNFQSVYTQYMLPQASEEIADPHNFLLEIAATTGLPGLMLFLWLLGLLCRAGSRLPESILQLTPNAPLAPTPFRQAGACPTSAAEFRWLLLGGIGGLLLTPTIMQIGEAGVDTFLGLPILWSLGIPLLCAIFWWSGRTSLFTSITPPQILLAIVVLLINLLAAGGISFPSIAMLIALLSSLLVAKHVEQSDIAPPLSARYVSIVAFILLYALSAGCYWSCYSMVLGARRLMQEAQEDLASGFLKSAKREMLRASRTDPWDPEPLRTYFFTASVEKESGFNELLIKEFLARNSRKALYYELAGDLDVKDVLPFMWKSQTDHYDQAIKLAPHNSLLRAKQAWRYFAANHVHYNIESSKYELIHEPLLSLTALYKAQQALHLNQLNPHADRKLSRQRFDLQHLQGLKMHGQDISMLNVEELMNLIISLSFDHPGGLPP